MLLHVAKLPPEVSPKHCRSINCPIVKITQQPDQMMSVNQADTSSIRNKSWQSLQFTILSLPYEEIGS